MHTNASTHPTNTGIHANVNAGGVGNVTSCHLKPDRPRYGVGMFTMGVGSIIYSGNGNAKYAQRPVNGPHRISPYIRELR